MAAISDPKNEIQICFNELCELGSWNATAMFMIPLFAQPKLAATMTRPGPMLPPGGPIFAELSLLHRKGFLSRQPSGSQLDDQAFEPGRNYSPLCGSVTHA